MIMMTTMTMMRSDRSRTQWERFGRNVGVQLCSNGTTNKLILGRPDIVLCHRPIMYVSALYADLLQ